MKKPKVLVVLGSKSDLPIIEAGLLLLEKYGILYEVIIASAHRNPKKVISLSKSASKYFDLIIAGAGMAAHLPGVIASHTILPVIGIPIGTKALSGFDALYSIVQMPPGVPVATVAIDGSKNGAILAVQILSLKYAYLKKKLFGLKKELRTKGKV